MNPFELSSHTLIRFEKVGLLRPQSQGSKSPPKYSIRMKDFNYFLIRLVSNSASLISAVELCIATIKLDLALFLNYFRTSVQGNTEVWEINLGKQNLEGYFF